MAYFGPNPQTIQSGSLDSLRNLSDLSNVATARTNLSVPELSGGVIIEDDLPLRLRSSNPTQSTNFNNELSNGVYSGSNTTSNTPYSGFWVLEVATYSDPLYLVQDAWDVNVFNGLGHYRRYRANGAWGTWLHITNVWEQIGPAVNASNVATIEWTDLSAYTALRLRGAVGVNAASSVYVQLRNVSAGWRTGTNAYERIAQTVFAGNNTFTIDSATGFFINSFSNVYPGLELGMAFTLDVNNFNSSVMRTSAFSRSRFYSQNGQGWFAMSGTYAYNGAEANDGIRLGAIAGAVISSHNLILEGLRG